MTSADERGGGREIARGLIVALTPALADVATPAALETAREAARILSLDGLDRLLAACAPQAGRPWPPELQPALERVRRLVAQVAEAGDVALLRQADRELSGLADEVAALHWSPVRSAAEAAPPSATLSVADTLDDVNLADQASRELARRARLLPPVAGALRAALDWLAGELGRPLTLREDDGVLEVQCERVAFEGLAPAGEVLAAVNGNLGPTLAGAQTEWLVRVPLHGAREVYLMLVRGGVPIAVPWHAVLRLRMAAAGELAGRLSLGDWPIVESPLGAALEPASSAAEPEERPLALVAHGRKRGWIAADRLVWRLDAVPVEPTEPPPTSGLTAMVETEEGERYWLAEPEWLLESVEAPLLRRESEAPPAAREPQVPPPAPERAPAPSAAPAPRASAEVPPARSGAAASSAPHLRLLTSADVEPIQSEEAAPGAPPAASPPPVAPEALPPPSYRPPPAPARAPDSAPGAGQAPPRPESPPRRVRPGPGVHVPEAAPAPPRAPAPAPGPRRAALIAEDSFTARMFLTRLLERLGFEVRAVDSAAALRTEFERGSWSLACVDVELPDEEGAAFLARLVSRYGERTPFVALVRDTEDRVAASRAGIERMLRKPFDHQELEQLLRRLGILSRGSA